jgi:hypothetical protein
MDNRSRETLRRVEQDDATLMELWIGSGHDRTFMTLMEEHRYVGFASSLGSDYSKLGEYIGESKHLKKLVVYSHGLESIPFPSREFARGLQRNSSIRDLHIRITVMPISSMWWQCTEYWTPTKKIMAI